MTKQEELMYDILTRISNTDIPIVFKGALVTKLILSECGFTDVERMTKDIDANWVGTPPSMEVLSETIYDALGSLQEKFFVDITREYGDNRSAGLCIRDKDSGDKIISMDIDIKSSVGSRTYYMGEASIKGVLVNEILADKISTMSSDAIYKHRTKDMIDVYSLAHCTEVNASEIFNVCKKVNRDIQSFNAFYNKIPEIEHAYNKLRGVIGKPDFTVVYKYLYKFIQPFTDKEISNKVWQPQKCTWTETILNVKKNSLSSKPLSTSAQVCKAPFSCAKLRDEVQKIREQSQSAPPKSNVHKKDDPSL